MKIGITGHQKREGIRWNWVENALRTEMNRLEMVDGAMSSLAAGSDQLFAEISLSMGIPVTAVIPIDNYASYFAGPSRKAYLRLVEQCETLQLSGSDAEQAFYEAGKLIVDRTNLMFAIWDGEEADGFGGTGDIVMYAQDMEKPVVHIDPITCSVRRLEKRA